MNILFLSLVEYKSVNEHGIYTDLLREFILHDNKIYIISPFEGKKSKRAHIIHEKRSVILRVYGGKIQKTNFIQKGINTILIGKRYKFAIKKYLKNVKFDLILYTTPPITFVDVVEYIKRRDGAKTYLLLKDIFPQNAVDIGLLKDCGLRKLLYMYFRKKEKKLYSISDYIGCMSQANVDYVKKHNPEITAKKIEVCPNSMEIYDKHLTQMDKIKIREKYDIPCDKRVFIYGGNLGKPQGIPFLLDCLSMCKDNKKIFILIVGNGTEYGMLENYFDKENPRNMKLMKYMPRDDYELMIEACDVGMIFLDHKFTIPNFPSRLLSYMQAKLPVLACTDICTDIGKVIVEGGFGWWCESNDVRKFWRLIKYVCEDDLRDKQEKACKYLRENYDVKIAYKIIMKHFVEC